ncbi:MAG: MFS transporter [Bdellovibrionaceae bacterium]|jgi:MFS transporter, OPA family, sugar phosphate sensor protein UhpC|nr:MFS transporter [Pseudobdellovibrionaceae bacterium]
MVKWFKTGSDIEVAEGNAEEMQSRYKKYQWSVFISLVLGYSFFYTTRLSLSVVKKPLIDNGLLTKEQLGMMGSALFFVYAFGKFTNGFLSDHANIKRFMSMGLFFSALINIVLGFSDAAYVFIILWGLNGWFQSMGSAPSCVSIFQWFQPSIRGSRYSLWAGSHNIGEGITFVLTSVVVSQLGWRYGFISPGVLSLMVAILIFYFLKDRPQTLGLPTPAVAFEEPCDLNTKGSTLSSQWYVLKSPVVWVIAASCAGMYVSRYAINSWGILFLQEAKLYSLIEAGTVMAAYPIAGLIGAVMSGLISDKFFNSRRKMPATIYGLFNVGGMALLFWGGQSKVLDAVALTLFGFGIGGLVVFLAGLMAADIMPKNAVGAVKGFIGLFAYAGASAQEYISSVLIHITEVGGIKVYDFSNAIYFWILSGVGSMFLVGLVRDRKIQFNRPHTN